MHNAEGSVRVDLLGGTLDIAPMHLILKNVVTLNLATTLKAKVQIQAGPKDRLIIHSQEFSKTIEIKSHDLNKDNIYFNQTFEGLTFVIQILDFFKLGAGVELTIASGAPLGSGLGGSSAMGVTLYKALCQYTGTHFDRLKAISIVQNIEGRILNKGMPGYQDYYPAVFGGVLGLLPHADGVQVDQLFDHKLKTILEERISLVYSGKSRFSGINNWEIYKNFFDGHVATRQGLQTIADLANSAYLAIKEKKYDTLIDLIGKEGECRRNLFPDIESEEMKKLRLAVQQKLPSAQTKVCGAGGGGCFLVLHQSNERKQVEELINQHQMEKLIFSIDNPIN